MKFIFPFFLFLFVSNPIYAQNIQPAAGNFARERTCDILHYKINIDIDEKSKTCEGKTDITLTPLRSHFDAVILDAADITISRIILNRRMLNFSETGETLYVNLDKIYGLNDTLTVEILYSIASPNKGLHFIEMDNDTSNQYAQVWSNGEPEENHFWFPCYDYPNEKSTSEVIATVNEKWTAVSNGKLIDVKPDKRNKKVSYHWFESKPHPSYLISLVAGEYTELKDSYKNIPLSYFVYPSQKENAALSFNKTPRMIEFFSNKIGYPYPWEKYSQTVVHDYIWGGMENVSATTLTDMTIHDKRAHLFNSSDDLVAHELAHQWWGNLVSFRDWSHAWLSEGFATYFAILFQEFDKGRDDALKSIFDAQNSIIVSDIDEMRKPTVNNRYDNIKDLFNNRIYGKGASILHMLRFILGDDLFWKAIRHYVDKFAFQSAETNDFKIAIEEATGYNLHWFFDQWLYKPGYPEFEVKSTWDQKDRCLNLVVKQVQKVDSLTGIFKTPVDIEIWTDNVPEVYREMITKAEEVFVFPLPRQPQLVIFDKGSTLIKKLQYQKSIDEWIYQLYNARDGIDRYIAVDELKWFIDSGKVKAALSKTMLEDRFWEVRREAVYILGDSKIPALADSLVTAYGDRDARVRAAVASVLRYFQGDKIIKVLQHAFEKDSSYVVNISALISLTSLDTQNAKRYCETGLLSNSYNDVIRKTALRRLSEFADEDAFNIIKTHTQYGYDPSLRVECLRTLNRVWNNRQELVTYFIELLNDPDIHVKFAVIKILGNTGSLLAIEPLQKIAYLQKNFKLAEAARSAIVKIQKK